MQKRVLIDRIVTHFGKQDMQNKVFAIWGLAFKPKTDDVCEAPALTMCKGLIELGVTLRVFDPEADVGTKIEGTPLMGASHSCHKYYNLQSSVCPQLFLSAYSVC